MTLTWFGGRTHRGSHIGRPAHQDAHLILSAHKVQYRDKNKHKLTTYKNKEGLPTCSVEKYFEGTKVRLGRSRMP